MIEKQSQFTKTLAELISVELTYPSEFTADSRARVEKIKNDSFLNIDNFLLLFERGEVDSENVDIGSWSNFIC